MTTSWREVRAQANLDEKLVARERAVVEIGALAYELKELREELGFSVERVAEDLGVEVDLIMALETEEAAETPFAMFMLYARHLGVDVELFKDED